MCLLKSSAKLKIVLVNLLYLKANKHFKSAKKFFLLNCAWQMCTVLRGGSLDSLAHTCSDEAEGKTKLVAMLLNQTTKMGPKDP